MSEPVSPEGATVDTPLARQPDMNTSRGVRQWISDFRARGRGVGGHSTLEDSQMVMRMSDRATQLETDEGQASAGTQIPAATETQAQAAAAQPETPVAVPPPAEAQPKP